MLLHDQAAMPGFAVELALRGFAPVREADLGGARRFGGRAWNPTRRRGEPGEGEAAARGAQLTAQRPRRKPRVAARPQAAAVEAEFAVQKQELLRHRIVAGIGTRPSGREADEGAKAAVRQS